MNRVGACAETMVDLVLERLIEVRSVGTEPHLVDTAGIIGGTEPRDPTSWLATSLQVLVANRSG